MTYAPLIGIVTYTLDGARVRRWPEGGFGVPAPYVEAVHRAGGRAVLVPPGQPGAAADVLEPLDGLLLAGGGDVDPSRYGGGAGPDLYGVDAARDELEIALVLAADAAAMPTLCICRGMQVMNVAFGGTLHAHVPDVPGLLPHGVPVDDTAAMHDVEPLAGSRLAALTKSGPLSCSSHHHQGVDRVGDGLAPTGWSADGLVEAVERTVEDQQDEWATWMLGVQWHPEETALHDRAQQSLFDALVLVARIHGSRARAGSRVGRTRAYSLAEPDPTWPARFEHVAEELREALGDLAERIDHVGSTSVPGLPAKPTIDIQVSMASMVPRTAYADPLMAIGFVWTLDPWDDAHEFFSRNQGDERDVHVHACRSGSHWERRHLDFRDWLRTHPEDAAAYATLKRGLAAAHPRDIHTYTHEKGVFIRGIEAKTLAEEVGKRD
ncbi:MAG: gamma-glutamyl-gamma-aminobutyrate hydrolase family protein [Actinomycetota bacterium]